MVSEIGCCCNKNLKFVIGFGILLHESSSRGIKKHGGGGTSCQGLEEAYVVMWYENHVTWKTDHELVDLVEEGGFPDL